MSLTILLAFLFYFVLMTTYRAGGVALTEYRPSCAFSQLMRFLTFLLFLPTMYISVSFFISRIDVQYGSGQGLSPASQALNYAALFCGLTALGALPRRAQLKEFVVPSMLIVVPRLIISMSWGRFYLAQAVIPVVLILVARNIIRFNSRSVAIICLVLLLVIFFPPFMRGDDFFSSGEAILRFFVFGGTLSLFQENFLSPPNFTCNPFLVGLTAKIFPWELFDQCTENMWGRVQLPLTMDRILALKELTDPDLLIGPGSNFLLETILSLGVVGALLATLVTGAFLRSCLSSLNSPSIFAGIYLDIATRALLIPRGNLSYVCEMVIPYVALSLFLVTMSRVLANK